MLNILNVYMLFVVLFGKVVVLRDAVLSRNIEFYCKLELDKRTNEWPGRGVSGSDCGAR